jgi:hypothetical protein
MRFRGTDVVTDITFNVEAAAISSLVELCRPLAGAVGATALVVDTADPDGGRRGRSCWRVGDLW